MQQTMVEQLQRQVEFFQKQVAAVEELKPELLLRAAGACHTVALALAGDRWAMRVAQLQADENALRAAAEQLRRLK